MKETICGWSISVVRIAKEQAATHARQVQGTVGRLLWLERSKLLESSKV